MWLVLSSQAKVGYCILDYGPKSPKSQIPNPARIVKTNVFSSVRVNLRHSLSGFNADVYLPQQ